MEQALLLIVHFTGLLIESTDWSKPKNQLSIPSEMFKTNDKFFGTQYSDNLFTSHTPMQYIKKTR